MYHQKHDTTYLRMVQDILTWGVPKDDRTGTGTISYFGYQMRFDLSDGTIPLLTTKKMHTKSIIHELLWFLKGDTNIKYLNDNGVTIWDEWADENGDLGPVYGSQWRRWQQFQFVPAHTEGYEWFPDNYKVQQIDQIAQLVHKLRTNPNDRRMLVSAWNVAEVPNMKLPPCHYAFQCWVGDGHLYLLLNQRSCDVGLGVPFNIAQYSILLHMLAQIADLEPGMLIWNGGDVHIYKNHIQPLQEQLVRNPYASPMLKLNSNVKEINEFKYNDFEILNYESHPAIKMDVAV